MSAQHLFGSPAAVATMTRCGSAGTPGGSAEKQDWLDELRIIVADDHPVVREGLKALLEARSIRVVGEASDAESAVSLVELLHPDVLLLDLSMPGLDVSDAIPLLRRCCPLVKVLVLSEHDDRRYVEDVLRAGASGYLCKYAAPDEIAMALRVVASGGVYLDPAIAAKLVQQGSARSSGAHAVPLSNRESAVLRLVARGFSNKEIAIRLSLSVKTVETYKTRMMDKLGFQSRPEVVAFAASQGWLTGS